MRVENIALIFFIETGPWSEWSTCPVTCGGSERQRQRDCGLQPRGVWAPRAADNPCFEELQEVESCNTKPCPVFTEWTEWAECSHSCNGGYRKKSRECVEPKQTRQYENPCKAPLEVIEECNTQSCPMWTEWGEWTDCSLTCGGGQSRRFRQCVDSATGEESFCEGNDTEERICNTDECPVYTEWAEWTECTVPCGGGTKKQIRECLVEDKCEEDETETADVCNESPCPEWTPWTEWGQCTATCGGGTTKRIRDCLLIGLRNGNGTNFHGCDGDTWEMMPCNTENCPTWTQWTEWTQCTKTCAGGRRVRTRECTVPDSLPKQLLALFCPGDEKIIEDCNTEACPKPTEWSEWGECTVSCGGGTRRKVRDCVNSRDSNGNPCNTDLENEEPCNEQPCPTWTPWTEWTECTKTCGGGRRKKARECVTLERGLCIGDGEMEEDCNVESCPSLTPWSEWTECTQTCGEGSQRRVRDCLVQRSGVGNACFAPLDDSRVCNPQQCPSYTEWSEWTECTAECGGGTKSKIRECVETTLRKKNLFCTGPGNASDTCNETPCPQWTNWSDWSFCSTTCGGGNRQRARECAHPEFRNGRAVCDGPTTEDDTCNPDPCPQWSDWAPWGECTASCGGGTRTSNRGCPADNDLDSTGSQSGSHSACGTGETERTEECNRDVECEVDPEWTPWSEWSDCSKTCGGGQIKRDRKCLVPRGRSLGRTKTCDGPATMTLFCNLDPCPPDANWGNWGEWSTCDLPCGGGERNRKRDCEAADPSNRNPRCPGSGIERQGCNSQVKIAN